ncbi:hypothetical protein [Thiothrix nivea]|uniref:Uncharacterized protein n=1 Tax=Thiothrix nivea (strain ATCC 35100 / DSM 5205 / JP2) TaxID=870187 RepID=A0A656HBB4_THINJ|nr:hypothetical protein [Thiothrix nivea]EIJ34411.1 hypothetical protein Thini_1830 [Thiothrix nivea DSM 5205]
MQHETPDTPVGDDDPADARRLAALYRAALLDEDFQQQVRRDIQALPPVSDTVSVSETAFVEDGPLPEGLRGRLRAMQEGAPAVKRCVAALPWWKQLWRSEGWSRLSLPAPGFTLPAAVAMGLLFGGVLVPLLRQGSPETPVLRGSGSDSAVTAAGADNACAITGVERADPAQWWAAIQRCEQQSAKEKQALRKQFPNYQLPSP